MKKRVLIAGVLILLGAAVWWGMTGRDPSPVSAGAPSKPTVTPTTPPIAKAPAGPASGKDTQATSTAAAKPTPAMTTAPVVPPSVTLRKQNVYVAELDKVRLMLSNYRTLMQENPVGTNAEIMKALMGGNSKHANLGPANGEGLNEKGELTDKWDTPIFFHQMSSTEMEIRSAGPDKQMWTSDDVVVR